MTNSLESEVLPEKNDPEPGSPGWVKLGVVAAASVLAGGLAAAWWYRNTLKKLNQAAETPHNPHFGISPDEPSDEG
jgi:hypothetical protein